MRQCSKMEGCVWNWIDEERSSGGRICLVFFFFNDTATTEIYTLSLHDALPISADDLHRHHQQQAHDRGQLGGGDRKSTRLNSSHGYISYAVFCLKKKNSYPVHLLT